MNIFSSNRANKIKSLVKKLDMEFISKEEFGMVELLNEFKLFKKGHNKTISNLIHLNEEKMSIYIFDYEYIIRRNNQRKKRKQSVLFVNSKELGLPQFSMRPENLPDTFIQWMGFEDIDF